MMTAGRMIAPIVVPPRRKVSKSHAGKSFGGGHPRSCPTTFATPTAIMPPAKYPTIANQHPTRYRARLGRSPRVSATWTPRPQYAASTRAAFTMSGVCGST